MLLTLLILFLAIALGGVAVGIILGYAKPWGLALGGLVSGSLYFQYIESWANYEKWVLVPAAETLLGTRVPGVWEFVAVYSLIVFIFMFMVFAYNMLYSWDREGVILPVIEFTRPEKK